MKRIYFTIPPELIERFDKACKKAGLTRSLYLSCLLSGRLDIRPPVLKYRGLIRELSSIERDLKVIVLKDDLCDNDRILIMEKLKEIRLAVHGMLGEGSNGT